MSEAICWCGGRVGPREPGDSRGLGCLSNIMHNWLARCVCCDVGQRVCASILGGCCVSCHHLPAAGEVNHAN